MAESISQVTFGGVPDESAPSAGSLNEPLRPQLGQGLSEEGTAHPKLSGHFRFGG